MPPSTSIPNASVTKVFTFWFDREVRFDISPEELEVQTPRGELLLSTLRPVEDTKGNNGEEGALYVTNLRCMWCSSKNKRKNLSVGYYCIQGVEVKQASSRLRGSTEALYISARFSSSRFEFVFTHLIQSLRLFATVPAVWRAYESSRIYRELRLRTSIIRDGDLILLSGEQLLTRERGVSNVSNEQGHIGTLFTTNIRLAWCAQPTSDLNVSIPLLQITALHVRMTKFGQALVIETSPFAGSYILGFRIDPAARLQEIFKECVALWKAWNARPILGIAIKIQDTPTNDNNNNNNNNMNMNMDGNTGVSGDGTFISSSSYSQTQLIPQPRVQDGENIVREVATDAFAAYYADVGQKGADRRPEYNKSIGLAVERLRSGVTLRDLWAVMT